MNMTLRQALCTGILFLLLFSGVPDESQATEKNSHKESSEPKHSGVKIDDLPQPIPKVLDTLKRIGNNVGEEISKAGSKTANAVKKAVQTDEPAPKK